MLGNIKLRNVWQKTQIMDEIITTHQIKFLSDMVFECQVLKTSF